MENTGPKLSNIARKAIILHTIRLQVQVGMLNVGGATKMRPCAPRTLLFWVAVKELTLSCHNPETISSTVYPYYGDLN